ncbi:MAG: amidohydrolase family protein [Erysipelotrichaceae bacterium]|nr:amidohydrolase family protein [Erysipelotrichaceae bacterium]
MKKIILGNIITMDENNMFAEAALVNNGLIDKVGNKEEIIKLKDDNTEVLDFNNNYVYPGFIEGHCHGLFAGYRAIGQASLSEALLDYDKYKVIIKKFIEDHPEKDVYLAAGWSEDERVLDHTYLDELCTSKPLIMNTAGGHSCLLNIKAMETFNINDDAIKKYGTKLVHVDENGKPTGYICEEAAVDLLNSIPISLEDAKKYILNWQDTAFSKGITAVNDAGSELVCKDANIAYNQLDKEGKLKLRTYAHCIVKDNVDDPTLAIKEIVEKKKNYEGNYYKIIGGKVFLDGVAEARTAWTVDDYEDEKGYKGSPRFKDEDKMVELLTEASKNNFSIHAHSEGDGATKFMLNCIKKTQAVTKDYDQRNILAHLHYIKPEDYINMEQTKSIGAVAPLWTCKWPGAFDVEVKSFGQRAYNGFTINSFIKTGNTIIYHSDYPISPILDISRSVYMAERRTAPELVDEGVEKYQRNIEEAVTRLDSLKALTINPAYAFKQEDKIGSIEKGKIANFAVLDKDLLHEDIDKLTSTKTLATIVDGEIVYKAN